MSCSRFSARDVIWAISRRVIFPELRWRSNNGLRNFHVLCVGENVLPCSLFSLSFCLLQAIGFFFLFFCSFSSARWISNNIPCLSQAVRLYKASSRSISHLQIQNEQSYRNFTQLFTWHGNNLWGSLHWNDRQKWRILSFTLPEGMGTRSQLSVDTDKSKCRCFGFESRWEWVTSRQWQFRRRWFIVVIRWRRRPRTAAAAERRWSKPGANWDGKKCRKEVEWLFKSKGLS